MLEKMVVWFTKTRQHKVNLAVKLIGAKLRSPAKHEIRKACRRDNLLIDLPLKDGVSCSQDAVVNDKVIRRE